MTRISKQKSAHKVIKISADVYKYIKQGIWKNHTADAALRSICGLPDKQGKRQKVRRYWVLKKPSLKIFGTRKEAMGAAIVYLVQQDYSYKKGAPTRPETPKRVKEVRG